jgi:hypothetical protein
VMIFTDHAATPSTAYWLNNFGEVHGLWAGLDHAAPGWHHIRVEGDRSRCEFDFAVDGVAGPAFRAACDPAGANVSLHHWIPPTGLTGSPVVAFSNLVVSRGTGARCRPWTLAKSLDLATTPTGAIAKTGGMNGQGPATVAGRTAWLQLSDWNVLEIPTGLTALDDQFAVEVDLYVPAAATDKTTYFNVFGQDAGAPYQFTAGAQVFSIYAPLGVGTANWERRTPSGLVADPTAPLSFTRDTWHTVRIEGARSTCRFAHFVDGAAVVSSTLPGCDTTGAYFILVGGGTSGVSSGIAWSNLKVYRR